MIIMIFIGLNMLTMTLDHYHQSPMWSFALDNLNMGFIVIFSAECILKIFALRQYYFKEQWNVFDFVVVIISILGKGLFTQSDRRGDVVQNSAQKNRIHSIFCCVVSCMYDILTNLCRIVYINRPLG
jgi:hypothetical protein